MAVQHSSHQLMLALQLARAIYGPKIQGRSRKSHNFYVVTLRSTVRKVTM